MTRLGLGRLAAYVLVVGVFTAGIWRVETTANQAQETADEVHEAAERTEAQRCVNQWDRNVELRQVIEDAVREGSTAGAGAVFDAAQQIIDEPLPEDSGQLLERAVDQRVRVAVDETIRSYPEPECDLEDAERRLGER